MAYNNQQVPSQFLVFIARKLAENLRLTSESITGQT